MGTPTFFDYAIQDKGGKRTTKFLDEMKKYIPYKELEELLVKEGVYKPKVPGKKGRTPYPSKVLLGSLFLQAWYGLSDPMTEEMIHDRLSFRKFLDIKADDDIPDETTICNFRNVLMNNMLFDKIFAIIKETMIKNKLILKESTLVDATLIHSSEPTKKRDSKGKVVLNKAADEDATYTSKRGRKHHGFKMHIASDTNGIIKEVITTTAKESDIKQLDNLTEDEKSFVFTDSGYMSKKNKKAFRDKGVFGGIIERRVRGQSKLRTKQQDHNKKFSKVRAVVELPFAFIKKLMNYTQTRFLGLEKNDQYHLLLATAYNLKRVPSLQRKMESI